jgi:hypothetical protein
MPDRPFRHAFAALTAAVTALVFTSAGAAAEESPNPDDDSTLNPTSARFHGEGPHVGARTIQHWTGQTTNPVNGVTYPYSMVGADPAGDDAATITVDIVPINVTVGGRAFNGSDVIPAVLASPIFQTSDYASTGAASTSTGARGAGGELSAGNVDVQLLDATMRSQFNKVGTDYHLYLEPIVRRPVTISVPAALGVLRTSRGGITSARVDVTWFQPQVEGLTASLHYLQPHRLALFITNDVRLYGNHDPVICCVFGAHGTTDTTAEGNGSDGRQSLQTFVWASWMTAGIANPATAWAVQDINGLSHEIAEWAADPFETNVVQPWFATRAPQYGCSSLLEVGDPTVGLGFSQGTNIFDQNAFTDGTYHPQDEVFLPWFMRTSPNDVSQATQGSATAGRYTFLGDLNRVAFFHQPPVTCTP